ncbi:MAG: hypothetical protein ACK5V0_08920 [Alphaproteobacteria bacterium]|jgi:hypothetical protein
MPRLSKNRPAPNPGALAFTLSQATQVSGLSRSTLRRRGKEGALRLFRAGGRMMVDGASLRAFLGVAA